MMYVARWMVILGILSSSGCGNGEKLSSPFPTNDMDSAEDALISFFDALSRSDFNLASQYHLSPNPLIFLYEDVDPEDAEALLRKACVKNEQSWCVFYCWKIKDVVSRTQISPDEVAFIVRFEDEGGNILAGGDNVTPRPCVPPGCKQDEYTYLVKKIDAKFYVDGIPVFTGCWP